MSLRSTRTRSSGARWSPGPTSPLPVASSRRPRPSSASRRARRSPCPAIAAKYVREEGADIVLGTLTFDLPLFNRNQAGRGVASARRARAQAELAAAERRVREDVVVAVARVGTARDAALALEGDALEGAEANVTLATRAYEAGKIGLADLLLIRRSAVEVRRDHVEALEELAEADAALARAVGSERLVPGAGAP